VAGVDSVMLENIAWFGYGKTPENGPAILWLMNLILLM
jgi:hypothetical protein